MSANTGQEDMPLAGRGQQLTQSPAHGCGTVEGAAGYEAIGAYGAWRRLGPPAAFHTSWSGPCRPPLFALALCPIHRLPPSRSRSHGGLLFSTIASMERKHPLMTAAPKAF